MGLKEFFWTFGKLSWYNTWVKVRRRACFEDAGCLAGILEGTRNETKKENLGASDSIAGDDVWFRAGECFVKRPVFGFEGRIYGLKSYF